MFRNVLLRRAVQEVYDTNIRVRGGGALKSTKTEGRAGTTMLAHMQGSDARGAHI